MRALSTACSSSAPRIMSAAYMANVMVSPLLRRKAIIMCTSSPLMRVAPPRCANVLACACSWAMASWPSSIPWGVFVNSVGKVARRSMVFWRKDSTVPCRNCCLTSVEARPSMFFFLLVSATSLFVTATETWIDSPQTRQNETSATVLRFPGCCTFYINRRWCRWCSHRGTHYTIHLECIGSDPELSATMVPAGEAHLLCHRLLMHLL